MAEAAAAFLAAVERWRGGRVTAPAAAPATQPNETQTDAQA